MLRQALSLSGRGWALGLMDAMSAQTARRFWTACLIVWIFRLVLLVLACSIVVSSRLNGCSTQKCFNDDGTNEYFVQAPSPPADPHRIAASFP